MSKVSLFKNKFITTLAVLSLLIFLHYINILKPVENFIFYLLLPAQKELYSHGVSLNKNWENANLNKKELAYRNNLLKNRISELAIDKSRLLELESENKILRQELDFLEQNEYQFLISRVVGNNFDQDINSYIIDKGFDDGIKIGQAVIVDEGIIVGKIYQVFPKRSELLLLTDHRSAVAAVAQNQDNSQGIVEGQYGLSMRMNLIPQNEHIEHKDLVITSGIEQLIPRGFVIGQVDKIETEVNELFQSAVISPIVDFKKLNIVIIVVGQ